METGNRSRAREGVEAKEQGEGNRGKRQKPTACGQSGQEEGGGFVWGSCGDRQKRGRGGRGKCMHAGNSEMRDRSGGSRDCGGFR